MTLGCHEAVSQGEASAPAPLAPELARALEEVLADGSLELPLLPGVASELLGLSADAATDAPRLAALLHRDPALAANVLRVANSPAYLPRVPIVSLQQAITRLGFRNLRDIAVASCLQAGVFRAPGREAQVRAIWRHSLASAAFGREIARSLRRNVESAFLCGLLHEVGKPLVLQTLLRLAAERGATPDDDALEAALDAYHVRAGILLAERWSLPSAVARAIAEYRLEGREGEPAAESAIVALADLLATHLLAPDRISAEELVAHPSRDLLNLYPEDLDRILEHRDRVEALADSMTT